MPRANSSNWAVNDQITAARLQDLNEDLDDIYTLGADRGRVRTAVSGTALRIDIAAFAYRIGSVSGQYAGGTDIVVTNSATNYVEIDTTGTIQINTSTWESSGTYARLATVTCSGGVVTAISLWKPDVVGGSLGGVSLATISDKTADYTVVTGDVGKVFTNSGASAQIRFDLPSDNSGFQVDIFVTTQSILLVPNGSDTIDFVSSTALTFLRGRTASSTIRLIKRSTTKWVVSSYTGTWEFVTGDKAFVIGGDTPADTVDTLALSTDTKGSGANVLTAARGELASTPGLIGYGYVGGGTNSGYQTAIYKLAMIAETWSTLASGISDSRAMGNLSNIHSTTKGYMAGGTDGTVKDVVDAITKSSDAVGTIAVLPAVRRQGWGCSVPTTAGYYIGGANVGNETAQYKLTYSGETWSTLANALDTARRYVSSAQDGVTAGYGFGGSVATSEIIKFTFASETSDASSASLAGNRSEGCGIHGHLAGYMCGGASTTIEKLLYSTVTRTTLSATLTGSVSNCIGLSPQVS